MESLMSHLIHDCHDEEFNDDLRGKIQTDITQTRETTVNAIIILSIPLESRHH